jgi:hypothetical protein
MKSVLFLAGELTFAPGQIDEWKQQFIDPRRFEDWADEPFFVARPFEPRLVAEMLALVAAPLGTSFVDAAIDRGRVTMRGQLGGELARAWGAPLAALFRVAAPFGAEGELLLVAPDLDIRLRILMKEGRSTWARISTEQAKVQLLAGRIAEAAARARRRTDGLTLRKMYG